MKVIEEGALQSSKEVQISIAAEKCLIFSLHKLKRLHERPSSSTTLQ